MTNNSRSCDDRLTIFPFSIYTPCNHCSSHLYQVLKHDPSGSLNHTLSNASVNYVTQLLYLVYYLGCGIEPYTVWIASGSPFVYYTIR